jgi:transketolase
MHFGVREHASAAIANGMSLTKLRSFWSGFFIFSDYARAAIRLSALMEIPVVHVFTHDSIGVGQDGPTHQPVEQLASLRAMPGILVLRPADANEVVETWRLVAAPCWELFDRQPREYQDSVLPPSVRARVGVEQASTFGWHRYVGDCGRVVGMHTFGASAPLKELLSKFGFTAQSVAQAARESLAVTKGDK